MTDFPDTPESDVVLWDAEEQSFVEKLSEATAVSPQRQEFLETFRSLPDPAETAETVVKEVVQAMQRTYDQPIEGGRYSLRLKGDIQHTDIPDPRDYKKIYQTLREPKGRVKSTYGVRAFGDFEVVDTKTGKVVSSKRVQLGQIPTPVFDRSFIVDGKKRFMMHQWRRKPGVFTRTNESGDIVTEFNVDPATSSNVRSFKVLFDRTGDDPDFKLLYKSSKSIPVWDIAKLLGAKNEDLEKAVGKKTAKAIISQSTDERFEKSMRNLYGQVFPRYKRQKDDIEFDAVITQLKDQFNTSRVDPSITAVTLGTKSDRISAKTLLASFSRLQQVANGEPEDDRESIALKKIYSPADLLAESVGRESTVRKYVRGIESRLRRYTDNKTPIKVDQLIGSPFEKNIKGRASTSMVQRTDTSTTPLDAFGQATSTTIMGEGAIGAEMAIPKDAKLLNPGSVGFLDPVHTPESGRAGVILNVPIRTRIVKDTSSVTDRNIGHSKLMADMLSPSGRSVDVSPDKLVGKVIGAFDQWTKDGGKFKPKVDAQGMVKGWRDGEIVRVKPSEVAYYLKDSASLFDTNSALIPFVNSIQGGRIGYSDKQTTQSVPLLRREAPLVQTKFDGVTHSTETLLAEEAGAVRSAYDGVVKRIVDKDKGERYIEILPKGKRKTVQIALPKNLMLGGGAPLDSTPTVKVGDEIKKGDLLADSTFTKDGVLAMGVNLKTAYLPYHTSTFEDSITVSQSAADKMASLHMYEEGAASDTMRLGKKFWRKTVSTPLPTDIDTKLDDDGVIKVGTIIEPGDLYLVGHQSDALAGKEMLERTKQVGLYKTQDRRGAKRARRFFEKRWDHSHGGEVVDVAKERDRDGNVIGAKVYVKTVEPMEVGDKVYGRHANKATIAEIVPDDEMPRNSAGEHLEILYNPAAVTGRINPSQNFETFLGKIAKKAGAPEIVENYKYESNWDFVAQKLKEAGVADGEDLYDPRSGKTLKSIGVGNQYILKAKHQVDHKSKGRGVGTFQESGLASKGKDGAQSLGELGTYGLLAQDAREFLRSAQLYSSEDRPEVWDALAAGRPLPPGRVPGAFVRFQNYLKAAGIDVERSAKHSELRMKPLTDRDVLIMSKTNGQDNVIARPTRTVSARTMSPDKGGLFDPKATGGRGGQRWSRFELSQNIPNPVYENGIRDVLGLKKKQFENIMAGIEGVKDGDKEIYGAAAVEYMLKNVDLKSVRKQAYDVAKNDKKASKRSSAYRTIKTIDMLERNKLSPAEAFMRKQVLVLPANMRDFKIDKDSGDFVVGDVNYLYRDLAMIDEQLKDAKKRKLPQKVISELESGLYAGMLQLMQTEGSAPLSGAEYQGIVGTITGRRPVTNGREVGDLKQSLLKKTLVQRRQVLSGRTVIGPNGDLDIDEIALPRNLAVKVYRPMLEAEYKKSHPQWKTTVGRDKLRRFNKALGEYASDGKKDKEVDRILERTVKTNWVALKRDPVLHKYGFQGFRTRLTDEKTIQLNPLVYGGFGADNDGDTMAVFAPVSKAANRELKEKLRPQANLFSLASGDLAYTLSHEAILGLNRITRNPVQKKPVGSFSKVGDARKAFIEDKIDVNDLITVGGQRTTLGRSLVNQALPAGMTLDSLQSAGIVSQNYGDIGLSKKDIKKLTTHIAVKTPEAFGGAANRLRTLGAEQATLTGTTLLMEDFKPVLKKEREAAEKTLLKKLQIAKATSRTQNEHQRAIRGIFDDVLGKLNKRGMNVLKGRITSQPTQRSNVNAELTFSGARVKPVQLQQVMMGAGAVLDGRGDVVGTPIMKSYTEGLDATGYWGTLHGARMGTVSKVIEVQDPGYLTKQLINTAMDMTVTVEDCGTKSGVDVDINRPEDDLEGRFLASSVKSGNKSWNRNRLVDGNVLSFMRQKGQGKIKVRSPATCEAEEGVCQKCVGALPNGKTLPIGNNFGILASQAIGERSTQLTLSTFHAGGVYEPGDTSTAKNLFQEASALLRMPGTMGGQKAVVSPVAGKVDTIKRNREKGGWDLKIQTAGNAPNPTIFLPGNRNAPDGYDAPRFYKKGRRIGKGDVLTDGLANPKEILDATGDMEKVRGYLTNRLGNLFAEKGVLRRNVEGVVRAMTGTVEVADPGGADLLPGQKIPEAQAKKLHKTFKNLTVRPLLRGVDVAPREYREDFLARFNYNNLRQVLTDAAQTGATSNYHSTHPIPALTYAAEFNRASKAGGARNKQGDY